MPETSPTLRLQLPSRLEFGPGSSAAAAAWIAARSPAPVLVVTSPPIRALCDPLVAALAAAGRAATVWDGVHREPSAGDLAEALQVARDRGAGLVVGLGGGSALDVAKLVAVLADGRQSLGDLFGIDRLTHRALPLVCIPTTAGTGSEVSPIAILRDDADGLKKGVISPHLVPDAAYVDPLLTVGMPAAVTAATGIDALTHCIEAYANRRAHPLVDAWALEGVRRIARGLPLAIADGGNVAARTDVAMGSLLGGLCLGPVNTAAVHALAYPLGSDFDVAHGVSNAVLLPHVLEFNIPSAPERYAAIAEALGCGGSGTSTERAADGIRFLRELNRLCGIPERMQLLGVPAEALERMAVSAMTVQRLLAQNPRELTLDDARDIYRRAW